MKKKRKSETCGLAPVEIIAIPAMKHFYTFTLLKKKKKKP